VNDSLRGQLLIASPGLADFFRRSVILVLEHTEEGAMGVVLNRPSEATVAEAVPVLAELAEDEDLVRIGGPVAPNAVVALGEFEDPSEAGRAVTGPLGVLDPDRGSDSLRRLRVYAGYAGWGPGQLDSELEQDAWIVELADPEDPFLEGDLWPVVLGRKGGEYALLATMPADPSQN
jgi:putative transcriptional regulator